MNVAELLAVLSGPPIRIPSDEEAERIAREGTDEQVLLALTLSLGVQDRLHAEHLKRQRRKCHQ